MDDGGESFFLTTRKPTGQKRGTWKKRFKLNLGGFLPSSYFLFFFFFSFIYIYIKEGRPRIIFIRIWRGWGFERRGGGEGGGTMECVGLCFGCRRLPSPPRNLSVQARKKGLKSLLMDPSNQWRYNRHNESAIKKRAKSFSFFRAQNRISIPISRLFTRRRKEMEKFF